MRDSSFPRALGRRVRGAGTIARGLVVAAALLATAKNADAACPSGASRSCTVDGIPGVQVCDDGAWGECTPPPSPGYNPIVSVDHVQLSPDGTSVTVDGWSADQDSYATPLQMDITVDGALLAQLQANLYRPDVSNVYPQIGSFHGYSTTFPAASLGTHRVCVRANNIGSGLSTTFCKSYTVAGKVTHTWGQTDVTRCVEDPIGAIANLPTTGSNFGFLTGADSAGLSYSIGAPHWQGVSRLAIGDGRHLVLSRSGDVQLSFVVMGDRADDGSPFGAGVSLEDFSFEHMGNGPAEGWDHAGGIQALGSLLAVPNENHSVPWQTQIDFFNMSESGEPTFVGVLGTNVLQSEEAGAVALARLQNDRILMAVGRTESFMLDFYISGPNSIAQWSHVDTFWRSNAHTALPDGDTDFGDYQGINFVTRCSDGAIFLVGTHRDGDTFGNDWVDLWQVEFDGNNSNDSWLTKVAARHVDCDGNCNMDAGGGVYVTPDGQLLVYGTEHAANGPEIGSTPTVKLREF